MTVQLMPAVSSYASRDMAEAKAKRQENTIIERKTDQSIATTVRDHIYSRSVHYWQSGSPSIAVDEEFHFNRLMMKKIHYKSYVCKSNKRMPASLATVAVFPTPILPVTKTLTLRISAPGTSGFSSRPISYSQE